MQKKKLEIRVGRQEQWNPTSTPWIFFFLSREFSYEHSERFLTFFLCRVIIWRVSNAKKISKLERERQEYNYNW